LWGDASFDSRMYEFFLFELGGLITWVQTEIPKRKRGRQEDAPRGSRTRSVPQGGPFFESRDREVFGFFLFCCLLDLFKESFEVLRQCGCNFGEFVIWTVKAFGVLPDQFDVLFECLYVGISAFRQVTLLCQRQPQSHNQTKGNHDKPERCKDPSVVWSFQNDLRVLPEKARSIDEWWDLRAPSYTQSR